MIIVVLPFMKRRGMAIFPFVFFKHASGADEPVLVNHEKIHLQQQKELLVLPFYLFYLINYLYNLIQMLNHEQAYRSIIFEKEAYDHQSEVDYLQKRKPYSFIYYL